MQHCFIVVAPADAVQIAAIEGPLPVNYYIASADFQFPRGATGPNQMQQISLQCKAQFRNRAKIKALALLRFSDRFHIESGVFRKLLLGHSLGFAQIMNTVAMDGLSAHKWAFGDMPAV